MLGAFSVKKERYVLSVLAFPLDFSVCLEGKGIFSGLELSIISIQSLSLTSKIQYLTSNLLNIIDYVN
ncbi:hypothetical protein CYV15_07875 [Riemerella anatipestifer]|nr:hypothetical protein [Riemerella anatipestifer]PST43716.1 hypothetical protein CYV15_07875 [Riemerella anatipestifer]